MRVLEALNKVELSRVPLTRHLTPVCSLEQIGENIDQLALARKYLFRLVFGVTITISEMEFSQCSNPLALYEDRVKQYFAHEIYGEVINRLKDLYPLLCEMKSTTHEYEQVESLKRLEDELFRIIQGMTV